MQFKLTTRTTLAVALLCTMALGGDLTERFQLTLERVHKGGPPRYTRELVLADVVPEAKRRFTEYSGDVSGRYVGALAAVTAYTGEEPPELPGVVAGILHLQKPGGFFGKAFGADIDHDEMALLWGNGRLLIGLLEYNRVRPSPETLAAARRLGDFLIGIAPRLNSEELRRKVDAGEDFAAAYICWTQQVEGLVELSRVTDEKKYLDLARDIAARNRRGPGQHSHGFLTSIRGVVELYKATGERQYLDQAVREWHGLIDSGNLLVQGAVPEAFAPKIQRDEGCSEADWLRLSLTLWRLTGEKQYLEQAERTLFNEFAVNQFDTGDYGSRVLAPTGISIGDGPAGAGMARCWWCCTLHGLRAYKDIFEAVFRNDGGTLWYDLPVDGRGKADGLEVMANSDLQTSASIRLTVASADGKPHALAVRMPEWASAVDIRVNGKSEGGATAGAYQKLKRTWKKGDEVELKYDMKTRAESIGKSGRFAIFHGPWLLSADEDVSPFFWDEPSSDNRLRVTVGRDAAVKLERTTGVKGRFSVPVARFKASYLPEGYPMLPQEVVLRPIAEQTGTASTAWYFLFRLEGQ